MVLCSFPEPNDFSVSPEDRGERDADKRRSSTTPLMKP